MTAALVAVLCGLSAVTLWGTLRTIDVTEAQSQALALDSIFSEARTAVAVQEMHTRQYQLEPSVASRARYMDSANAADTALRHAVKVSSGQARRDAQRLLDEQDAYRMTADRLIELVTDRNPTADSQDDLSVTPTYFTLQHDIDSVSRAYHSEAQRLVSNLRQVQTRIVVTTILVFGVGLALVAMIWRVMLGYQRRIIKHADASQRQATHDPLTGLPNRLLFERRLHDALRAAAADGSGSQPAIMLLDLNGFKGVNDTLGHQAGDEVLVETGHRLKGVSREGDTVARLGGDEFVILLPMHATVEVAGQIAERAAAALRRNYSLAAGSAAVSASIGIVIAAEGMNVEGMLRQADAAMYRAKTTTRGVVVYDPQVDADHPNQMALFGDLRALLDRGDPNSELVLYYQPQVRLSDATVTAAEALVRWRHPQLGLLYPDAFLTIAEGGGLEIPLTYHLLNVAVAEAACWNVESYPRVVCVNISPNCLLDDAFVGQVRSTLATHGLPPMLLRLEVMESAVTADPGRALARLRQVQEDGVQVSIDDYGTGFSSLTQLKQLTADELKIDRTFVKELATNPEDAILVRSAIDLAHALRLIVTAEGVEDPIALAILRDLECDQAQGFTLAYPVPADDLPAECLHAEQIARALLTHPEGTTRPGAAT